MMCGQAAAAAAHLRGFLAGARAPDFTLAALQTLEHYAQECTRDNHGVGA